jgi:hypothetical protein
MNLKKGQMILLFCLGFICNDKLEISQPSPSEEQSIRQIGQQTAGILLNSLQNELKAAISNEGMLAAISICNIKAMHLTDSIKQSIDEVFEVKRTSLRYRNPNNAPDALERDILVHFQSSLLKTGSLPEAVIEKINDTSNPHFRYYKPLAIKSICLNCHGQSDNITSEVFYRLKKLYPEDRATGYTIDQFRGMVSISIR